MFEQKVTRFLAIDTSTKLQQYFHDSHGSSLSEALGTFSNVRLEKMSTYTLLTCDIIPEGITVEAVVRLELTLPTALG